MSPTVGAYRLDPQYLGSSSPPRGVCLEDPRPGEAPRPEPGTANRSERYLALVEPYQRPTPTRSILQVVGTLAGFLLLWYVMYRSLSASYALALLLALPTAGLLVRLFIVQHDCSHGSFFRSRRANRIIGRTCSLFTAVPYRYWQRFHALHHATSGKMDERGVADVVTLTVREFYDLGPWGRLKYRVYRNPLVLFVIGPTLHFVCLLRLPLIAPRNWRRERRSIWLTNLALAGVFGSMSWLIGVEAVIKVHLPIVVIASSVGLWLFYVQHQFEDGYWLPSENWDYVDAALRGSSYLKLSPLLRWFTGSIGFHHIHHLSPRIPNYLLRECHESTPELQNVPTLGLREGFATMWLKLWDEDRERLVSFREARRTIVVG